MAFQPFTKLLASDASLAQALTRTREQSKLLDALRAELPSNLANDLLAVDVRRGALWCFARHHGAAAKFYYLQQKLKDRAAAQGVECSEIRAIVQPAASRIVSAAPIRALPEEASAALGRAAQSTDNPLLRSALDRLLANARR